MLGLSYYEFKFNQNSSKLSIFDNYIILQLNLMLKNEILPTLFFPTTRLDLKILLEYGMLAFTGDFAKRIEESDGSSFDWNEWCGNVAPFAT